MSPGRESSDDSSGRSGSSNDNYDTFGGIFGGEVGGSGDLDDDEDKNCDDTISVIIVSDALLPISTQITTNYI